MIEYIIWSIGLVIIVASITAYRRTKDPLHPLIYLGPMFLYIYCLAPASAYYRGDLSDLIPDEGSLIAALFFTFLAMTAFCIGCLRFNVPFGSIMKGQFNLPMNPKLRVRLARTSYALAIFGITMFFYRLSLRGGLIEAFSTPKGGGASLASGYFTVAPLLTIPAIMLLLLSRQGLKMNIQTVLLVLIYASPHLIQGLLGGSRGPTFLALASIGFGWYLARGTRPSFRIAMASLLAVGMLIMFLKAHRQQLYLGSQKTMESKGWAEILLPGDTAKDHASIYSLALIAACDLNDYCLWGKGFFAQLIVRPIPKQFWPNKYEAIGMDWMTIYPGSAGLSAQDWRTAVGWQPNMGTAAGFVSDCFLQFSWAGLLICYGLGAIYGWLWKKAVLDKGVWSLLFFDVCVNSIYLPSQGLISAWGYRTLYVGVPTIILWYLISFRGRQRRELDASRPATPAELEAHAS